MALDFQRMALAGGKLGLGERLRQLLTPRERLLYGGTPSRRLAEPQSSVSGARFGLVGLSQLREHLGERWPELVERVHALAQAVIARHLTRGDVFDAHGEDGYIVLFAQLSKAEAEFKCRVIAKEIHAKLLGTEGLLANLQSVTIELEHEAVVRGGDLQAALDEAVAKGAPLEPDISSRSGAILVERQRGLALAPGLVISRSPARARATSGEMFERSEPATYEPIWDFGSSAMLRFRLLPPPDGMTGEPIQAAKQDVAALTKALFDLGRLAQLGRRLAVICPVHLTTLGRDSWRGQLTRMLKECPQPLRRLLTLEVIVPDQAPPAWPLALQARCAGLAATWTARLGLGGKLAGLKSAAGLSMVSLELPPGFSSGKAGVAQLGAFASTVSAAGLDCGVLGLEARPLVLAASAAGFSQLSGPAVHKGVPALNHAVRFDLISLYRDLLPPKVAS